MREIFFCLFLCLTNVQSDYLTGPTEVIKWTREVDIGTAGFHVKFSNDHADFLLMEISARASGYVAIGFSPNGAMQGSDILMAWFDSNGKPQIKDMHAYGNFAPVEDTQNDYELLSASRDSNGIMKFRFSRPWDTCDENDYVITEDTVRLIWAFSDQNPETTFNSFSPTYHGADFRGGRSIFLKVPTHLFQFPDKMTSPDPSVKFWDVTLKNVDIPSDDTVYYCKIMKAPNTRKKFQIIGFSTIIEEANAPWVHHINFFECSVPDSLGGSRNVFEKYLDHPGGFCYRKNMPPEWGKHCMTVPFVWTAGAEGVMLPDHVGIPLGEEHGGSTYFMLEIHYDNPKRLNFRDSSGVRVFVTDNLRPNDAGLVTMHTRFSQFQLIPPYAEKFKSMGYCTSECTKQTIPPEGITVTHAMLHAHLQARKMVIRHIRDGVELEPIAQDNHYDFNYQQTRLVSPNRKVLPGDIVLVECEYNTENKNEITHGGTSTRDEMCQGYIYFYPRIRLSECKSQVEFKDFFSAFGINPNSVDGELQRVGQPYHPYPGQKLDPADDAYTLQNGTNGQVEYPFDIITVPDPKSSNKITFSRYLKGLNWRDNDKSLIKKIHKQWWEGTHDVFCMGDAWERFPLREYQVKYPQYRPYVKPVSATCQRRGRQLSSAASSVSFKSGVILQLQAIWVFVVLRQFN